MIRTITLLIISLTSLLPLSAKELPPQRLEDIKLQIYLDQQLFGPGVLDGKLGTYTRMAIEAYNRKFNRPLDDWKSVREEAAKMVPHPFALATVPEIAKKYVNPKLPSNKNREAQAKEKQMSYRSLAEFMAERYHTTKDLLIALNGSKKINHLKLHSPLRVPNVAPFLIEVLADGRSYKKDDKLSNRWVVVDTKKHQLRIFEPLFTAPEKQPATTEGDTPPPKAIVVEDDYTPWDETKAKLISAFPITPGKPQFIHYGVWKIKNAIEFPTWRYDKAFLHTGKRSKNALNIPGGPNNPVGVLWIGLTKSGIGIHGTNSPRTIGRAQSSGCIRMTNWDVVRVPNLVRPGATVIIK